MFVSNIAQKSPFLFTFDIILKNYSEAGRLRQILMSQVKTQAIDVVRVNENISNMPHEVISQRVQLIHFKNDPYALPELQLKTQLRAIGPGNLVSGMFVGDLEPVYNDILIAVLGEGDKIELEADFTLGKGEDHAKWCPTVCVTFRGIGDTYSFVVEHTGVLSHDILLSTAYEILKSEQQ